MAALDVCIAFFNEPNLIKAPAAFVATLPEPDQQAIARLLADGIAGYGVLITDGVVCRTAGPSGAPKARMYIWDALAANGGEDEQLSVILHHLSELHGVICADYTSMGPPIVLHFPTGYPVRSGAIQALSQLLSSPVQDDGSALGGLPHFSSVVVVADQPVGRGPAAEALGAVQEAEMHPPCLLMTPCQREQLYLDPEAACSQYVEQLVVAAVHAGMRQAPVVKFMAGMSGRLIEAAGRCT